MGSRRKIQWAQPQGSMGSLWDYMNKTIIYVCTIYIICFGQAIAPIGCVVRFCVIEHVHFFFFFCDECAPFSFQRRFFKKNNQTDVFTTLSYGAVNLNAATQDMYEYLWNNVLDYCDILILKAFSVIRKLILKNNTV